MKAEYIETLKKIVENGIQNGQQGIMVCEGQKCVNCPFSVGTGYRHCGVVAVDWFDLIRISKNMLDITS